MAQGAGGGAVAAMQVFGSTAAVQHGGTAESPARRYGARVQRVGAAWEQRVGAPREGAA
ncbi:hypothetical protein [Kribbella sp. NPDC004875]|uniref:hypothetical protein n=1 Tax=Kribbella sp. NPDC004875 TaxID=3364107 RepID=UPI00369C30B7